MKVLPMFTSGKNNAIANFFNNKKRILLILALLFGSVDVLNAQTVILKRDTEKDTVERKFGKNKKFYANVLVGFGFMAGASSEGLPLKYGNSSELVFGLWGKRKLNHYFSLVPELNFRAQWYRIAQEQTKTIPDNQMYELERYTFPTLNPNIYVRTQLKPHKGNHFGTFVDVGAGINIPFWVRHRRVIDDQFTGNEVVVIRKNLSYIQPIQLTTNVRLGYKMWNIYAVYRLTDIFDQDNGQKLFNQKIDLPRVVVGGMLMF